MTRRAAIPRVVALCLTAAALAATSPGPQECPPESGLVPTPVTLAVESTCGPPGEITATAPAETASSPYLACKLQLVGAEQVGLGSSATIDWDDNHQIELSSADGHRCTAWETDAGVFTLRCYAETAGGCGGDNVPVCGGTIRIVPASE